MKQRNIFQKRQLTTSCNVFPKRLSPSRFLPALLLLALVFLSFGRPEPVLGEQGEEAPKVDQNEISLPTVPLSSPDADAVNQEIRQIETTLLQSQEELAQVEDDPKPAEPQTQASVYQGEELLSIGIRLNSATTDEASCYLYTFRLDDGELLSDEELLEVLTGQAQNFEIQWEKNMLLQVKEDCQEMENSMKEALSRSATDGQEAPFPSYLGQADQLFADTLAMSRQPLYAENTGIRSKSSNHLYIDAYGQLRMVFRQASPAGSGFFLTNAPFYVFAYPQGRPINPLYSQLEQALELDLAEDCQGLMAYFSLDFAQLNEDLLDQLGRYMQEFHQETPAPLLASYVEQYYLFVPRYAGDFIEIFPVTVSDSGEIVEDPDQTDNHPSRACDSILIGTASETVPAAGFRLSNSMEQGPLFYPQISGRDGSVVVPQGFQDISAPLEDRLAQAEAAPTWITEEMKLYLEGWARTQGAQ